MQLIVPFRNYSVRLPRRRRFPVPLAALLTAITLALPSAATAAPETIELKGSAHHWQPTPRFETITAPATLSKEAFERGAAGDIDCDGAAEIVTVSPDGRGIFLHSFAWSTRAVSAKFIASSVVIEPDYVIALVRLGRRCKDVVIYQPRAGSLESFRFSEDGTAQARRHGALLTGPIVHFLTVHRGEGEVLFLITKLPLERGFQSHLVAWDGQTFSMRFEGEGGGFDSFKRVLKGDDDSMILRDHRNAVRARSLSGHLERPLLQPPEGLSWLEYADGDFNGDGWVDFILPAKDIRAAWIAVGGRDVTVEQPLTGLPKMESSPKGADLDGDGLDDLVDVTPEGLRMHRSMPGPPAGGVALQTEQGSKARSDSNGRFSLHLLPGANTEVAPSDTRLRVGRKLVRGGQPQRLFLPVMSPGASHPIAPDTLLSANEAPFPCTSYITGQGFGKWGRQHECPPHHAVMEVDDALPSLASLTCCKLPSERILSDESQWVSDVVCPAGSVVTGVTADDVRGGDADRIALRCTKINNKAFGLLPPKPGRYWGLGHSSVSRHGGVSRLELPAAIRSAVGREGFASRDEDGCIGTQIGSLLVGRHSRQCGDNLFAELVTMDGKPMKLLPDCRRLSSDFDPLARCIRD